MQLLDLSYPSAEENLAFEEWYFQHFDEETLRIWINPPSVISGKHQNVLAECNLHACRELKIPILRRISGGGTVYHDYGNINFSFFRFVDRAKMIDYDRSLHLIQSALTRLGFPVTMSKRHDLFLGENKISGNAQHLRSGRVLHHGTILYDANLDSLRSSIKRNSGSFIDKGVKSVRSPIANLRAFKDLGSADQFKSMLIDTLLSEEVFNADFKAPHPSEINDLIISKYSKDKWNYGYSPSYEFHNELGAMKCSISTERGGNIVDAKIFNQDHRLQEIEGICIGKNHFYHDIKSALIASKLSEKTVSECLKLLF